jgi:large subunit ribosomal protein L10
MANRLKQLMAEEMSARYRGRENVILVGYRGMSGASIAEFRAELRKEGVHLRVVRNRITIKAFAELGKPEAIAGIFDGPTAVMDGDDPVAMAKAAVAFAGRNPKLEVKGGVVEGEVLDAKGVRVLAAMPGRVELLAGIAALVIGPGGMVVAAIKAPGGRIAGALKAMADKPDSAGEGKDASGSPEPQAA